MRTAGFILGLLFLFSINAFAESKTRIASRYEIKGPEVFDRYTGLTWARCVVGQEYRKDLDDCVNAELKVTFQAAERLQSNDWRLPSKEELLTLAVRKTPRSLPEIDYDVFPFKDPTKFYLGFWTSSPSRKGEGSAVLATVNGGWCHWMDRGKLDYQSVRLVRRGVVSTRRQIPYCSGTKMWAVKSEQSKMKYE